MCRMMQKNADCTFSFREITVVFGEGMNTFGAEEGWSAVICCSPRPERCWAPS